jgi:hypothetical protein
LGFDGILNRVRFLARDFGDRVAVYLVKNGRARVWNASERRWVTVSFDWTGIGGSSDYDDVTDDEAAEMLLRKNVRADELFAVMLGLNPDESDLAKALRGD